MIRLKYNTDLQKFAITCSELQTLTAPTYLFVFINAVTKEISKAILSDQSAYPKRYNLFQLQGDTLVPGWYDYKVYEQEDAENMDPTLSVGIVEEGRLYVEPIDGDQITEYNNQITFKEYVG